MPQYLNIRDAADYLGISPHTLYKLVERREVPASKVGGAWRLNPEALDAFLQGGVTRGTRSPEILVVEHDDEVRRDMASIAMSRGARTQMAAGSEDALLLLSGGTGVDLVLYGVPPDPVEADVFLQRAKEICPDCRIALMVEPERASELGGLMRHGPMIMLRKPVERPDVVSLLALI
ncbi:MAG: helix-turn-helix domain-containing protein [Chloroflexi bacterium]|nr:helix-turn-helix domain-containing protein [Chloroflexota bacterium]